MLQKNTLAQNKIQYEDNARAVKPAKSVNNSKVG